jgi:uncharacterized protein YydD (DUF2326 family)
MYSLDKFKKTLESFCFSIPDDVGYLSFRSLIPFFLRPARESYENCMKPAKTHMEYQSLLNNALLLGLDVKLAERKYSLRKEQERIRTLEKNFKDDQLLHDYFTGNKDIILELAELDDQVKKIESDLAGFQVAEDYHDIQEEAEAIKTALFALNNEIVIIQNNIRNIEDSLSAEVVPAMTVKDLEKIYSETNIFFSESVKKTLDDVEIFYDNLIKNRVRRLSEQKNQLRLSLVEKTSQQSDLQRKFDELLKYLGEHQALDLFVSMSQKCADLKADKENLLKYQNLQVEYKSRERKTERDLIDLSEITDKYLTEIDESTIAIKEYFRTLAKRFYPNNTAGLTVQTNEGENQLVFIIEPRIESDASDGINHVKIFCYDLSILFEGKNHKVDFIFHDSRLFDGIDERQKTLMFNILNETFTDSTKQYIATINQNQLNEIKANMPEDDYKNTIEVNTILTLTDEADTEKLLGIQVDIGNN